MAKNIMKSPGKKGLSNKKRTTQHYNKLLKSGQHDELLELLKDIRIESDDVSRIYFKAQALYKSGKQGGAMNFLKRARQLCPENTEYLRTAALWLEENNRILQCLAAYTELAKRVPDDASVLLKMGVLLEKLERFRQAIVCFKMALKLQPENPAAFRHIGFCYYLSGDLAKAAENYEQAVALGGNTSPAWVLIGGLFLSKGERENATEALKKAIEVDEHCYFAYPSYVKSALFTDEERDALIEKLEHLLKHEAPQTVDKRLCHFSLGGLYHKQQSYDTAFSHFELGNKYRSEIVGSFNVETLQSRFEWFRDYIDRDLFVRERGLSSESTKPVFVVGMPRSGTTLLEQIVASHAAGFGAGELPAINSMFQDFGGAGDLNEAVFKRVQNLNRDDIETLSRNYLDQIEWRTKKAERIVDKMPQNQLLLWLIALLFPAAPIIQCVRDPLDTCLSCFITDFNSGHTYKENLYSLGQYYSIFSRVMDLWKEVIPNPILTVQYEELIENPEVMTRKVIDHIGLDWDPNCLELRDRGHFSQTASNLQIRQGIYKTSVKRWQKYEKHLGPLMEGLEYGRTLE